VGGRPSVIRLAINGKDLMLAGRFNHWTPVAVEGGGTGGESAVQLFFDVTSLARTDETEDLFEFTSHQVKRIGDLAFLVKGTMKQGDVERPVDAVVQTPVAHTPFVAITLPFEAEVFPEIWSDMSALVSARVDGESAQMMHPQAWLKAPSLAAA
jgi:hypothetical protein